ncbi:VWA domain-containing protein [Acidipila sp. EB88]|uniref:VWA domain-containing protein n=1 Tax=Acidipila sp. EB88 TaxID=2305226 RepID=UPI000F5E3420|nr:VWA domain-containing protein [Acidipila sp. EB88]RRA49072.1 VWA domain-containing protein [Acidipila sp. EB88]
METAEWSLALIVPKKPALFASLLLATALAPSPLVCAQQPTQTTPTSPQTTPSQQTPDQTTPEQGGPAGDNGAIAIPRKKVEAPPPPPPPEPVVKNPPQLSNYSLRVDVPVVNVDVGVILEKTHQFVPNLQEANFRVYEDGKLQQVTHFSRIEAPITAVLLTEFAATNYHFIYDMRNAAYAFAQQLKPDDYIAVVTYDMHTEVLTDFTQDKRLVEQALSSLMIPTWRETNLFDAVYETLDRLSRVEGRKYVILVSSGVDTFSKLTLDKTLAKIKATPNVTIYAIGTGQFARIMAEGRGMGGAREIGYLQADNQLSTFARMTGGQAFFPRFEGEMPDIFHEINNSIRNQYALSYRPTNTKQDGSYRRIQVELVDNEGNPLRMQDEKNKPLKYDVIARDGYRAKLPVE